MGKRDPRVDAYIAKQPDFAKPVLAYLRDVVHQGCPDCEESIKWGAPAFSHNGLIGIMAAFKEYAAFNLWKGTLIVGPGGKSLEAAGSLGKIRTVSDLPPKAELIGYVKKAVELNEKGVKAPPKRAGPKKAIPMPPDLKAALAKNKKAKTTYDAFSPSHKREYVEWITTAKGADTRERRVKQAVDWMAEGKPRMWKYQ
jgi:uncharacterized protein YdeI (YjbR/CyaY-like superfamily)